MVATLVNQTSTDGGFSWTGLIIVLVVFAAVYPLQRRLRATLSARRRRQWAESEGRDEPPADPEARS